MTKTKDEIDNKKDQLLKALTESTKKMVMYSKDLIKHWQDFKKENGDNCHALRTEMIEQSKQTLNYYLQKQQKLESLSWNTFLTDKDEMFKYSRDVFYFWLKNDNL